MKVVANVLFPLGFFFSNLLHILHSQTPFLKTPFKNPIKKKPLQETNCNNKCKNNKFKDEIKISLKTNQTKSKAMFGFVPCTLKKKIKNCKFIATCNQCFCNVSCNYFLSKVSIQVDLKFNGPIKQPLFLQCKLQLLPFLKLAFK